MSTIDGPETSFKFICTSCDTKTNNKKDYNKHCLTAKHTKRIHLEISDQETHINIFTCKTCSKEYKARNSLWYHEKGCTIDKKEVPQIETEVPTLAAEVNNLSHLVHQLIKSNMNLHKQIAEICKNINNE